MYNPINALVTLKRFLTDWEGMKSYAEDYLQADDLIKFYDQKKETVALNHTKRDYDAAINSLLRLQDMYQLDTRRLALGEVNGVKVGFDMTWSDCLDISLKSSQSGYQIYAKHWMETALDKLSNIVAANNKSNFKTNEITKPLMATKFGHEITPKDKYVVDAKLAIVEALLSTEYKTANFKEALKLTNDILDYRAEQRTAIEYKILLEKMLQKNEEKEREDSTNNDVIRLRDFDESLDGFKSHGKQNLKIIDKTEEESMIKKICRQAIGLQKINQIHNGLATITTSQNYPSHPLTSFSLLCTTVTNNSPFLFLLPLKFELLSLEPYIVIYHNVLSDTEVEELKDLVVEKEDGTFEFTKIDDKHMRQFNGNLHYILEHYEQELFDDWHVESYNLENLMALTGEESLNCRTGGQAKVFVTLQEPVMGGSMTLPQLGLAINLSRGSILYWSTLNEHQETNYRSKYFLCPVLGGTQIIASANIRDIQI